MSDLRAPVLRARIERPHQALWSGNFLSILREAFPELSMSEETYYYAYFLIDKDCIFGNIY